MGVGIVVYGTDVDGVDATGGGGFREGCGALGTECFEGVGCFQGEIGGGF